MAPFIVTLAKWLSPDFFALARSSQVPQLLSISVSHYCELASWSLKQAGIKFNEHGYAPGQHVLPVLALRVGGATKHLSSSSRMKSPSESVGADTAAGGEEEGAARRQAAARRDQSARATAVPVVALPDGSVLLDSWSIAAYSGLAPIDPELQSLLDDELGPLARQYAYSHIFKPKNINIFHAICTRNMGFGSKLLWNLYLGNKIVSQMTEFFRPHDVEAVRQCRAKLVAAVERLDGIVSGKTTPYLGGEKVGVADIAISSLIAPLVSPRGYAGGVFDEIFDQLLRQDPEVARDAEYWKSTLTGKYALEIYEKHR
jgi:glutathione S-transferase